MSKIIREYIAKKPVDYVRLRWFYRRLSQIGHPGAMDISLKELSRLGPCFANICAYLSSVQSIEEEQWRLIGRSLLRLLDSEEVKASEYYRLSILSLFTRNTHTNHFSGLASRYQSSDSFARREILLAAKANSAIDWLRQYKESFPGMDQWQRNAFLYCASELPVDERKYFINQHNFTRPFEMTLAKWVRSRKDAKSN